MRISYTKSAIKMKFIFLFAITLIAFANLDAQVLTGIISNDLGSPISNARVTLFNNDTSLFRETRTDINGRYVIDNLPGGGPYLFFGVSSLGREYFQNATTGIIDTLEWNAVLLPETNTGSWEIIMQSPHPLGGTDLGIVMPDGSIYYCHSTKDPFYFIPSENDTLIAIGHDKVQGCVGPALLSNGKLLFAGGTEQEIYGPGTRKVKTFDPLSNQWTYLPNMLDYRWYPSLTPLYDERLLIVGGGGLDNPKRVKTSEVYDPFTGTTIEADTVKLGNEVSPILPLLNGKILMTHRPPQLFDPETMQWDEAADFVQGKRLPNGDHSDHELVLLPDGKVLAVGYKSFTPGVPGVNLEVYDPDENTWTLRSHLSPTRSRAKAVLLPDQKVIVMGGYKEDNTDPSPVNNWGYMDLTDQYDPATDTWRRLSPMNINREYHAITALVPDGRIIAVGGEGSPGNEPPQSIIEAFSPPYLFKGVRPEIHDLLTTEYKRNGIIQFHVEKTNAVTGIILMSNAVLTHFMNSSNNRFLELEFEKVGNEVKAFLPEDSLQLMPGWYMMFAMVDDIPSVGKIIKISSGVSVVTSVTDPLFSNIKFNVFPNPATGRFFVEIEDHGNHRNLALEIFDLDGKSILQRSIHSEDAPSSVEIILPKNISAGIYYVKLSSDNDHAIKKVMLN